MYNVNLPALDATITLLKSLDERDKALNLLQFYLRKRGDDRQLWFPEESGFQDPPQDIDVRNVMAERQLALAPQVALDPSNVLRRWGKRDGGLTPNEEEIIARLSIDEFVSLFHSHKNIQLRSIIAGALQFRDMQGVRPELQNISLRAVEALRKIGKENRLNMIRVRRLGIGMED